MRFAWSIGEQRGRTYRFGKRTIFCQLPTLIACMLLSVNAPTVRGQVSDGPTAAQRAETARRYDLDPASPLESRVRPTPTSVLKMFAEAKLPTPTTHTLTEAERRKLSAAFASLPPLHRRILSERLRSITFLDGMPNTGLTSTVNPDQPYQLFDITLRAGVFHQSASEWLTEKERSCFDAAGSPLSVSIDAGETDALVFVLLHEATHIVDSCLGLTPPHPSEKKTERTKSPTGFTRDVWSENRVPVPAYRDPLRESVRFYVGGKKLPVSQAEEVYASLRRTPFVSLYGASNWNDDVAEYASVYHWTAVLKQPYRIVIRKDGRETFVYEPMRSDLVRSRLDQVKRFYEAEPRTRREVTHLEGTS